MRVAFDQQVFLLQRHGGISRYVCSLAERLTGIDDVDVRVIAPLHVNEPLRDSSFGGGRIYLPKVPTKLFRLVHASSTALGRMQLSRLGPSILHETYFTTDNFSVRGCPRVVTVYDMIHERFPERFQGAIKTSLAKRAAVDRADHVVCISESTRDDLISLWGVPENKLSVTYLAADAVFSNGAPTAPSVEATRPYLLIVGSRGGYKNFLAFLRAFGTLRNIRDELDIVCFGGGRFTAAELAVAEQSGLRRNRLIQVSGNDDALARLYARALAFVYPSLYEGFGIPPLEAMAADCPVIVSNTSSLPEVVGNAGEYFDPEDEGAMADAIRKVVESSERRAELIELGRQRRMLFSWGKCAGETLDIYRSLL